MKNQDAKRILVSEDGTGGPYIAVPVVDLKRVVGHLRTAGVPCSPTPNLPKQGMAVINLGKGADVSAAQHALDTLE
jgi:hypothetical protein